MLRRLFLVMSLCAFGLSAGCGDSKPTNGSESPGAAGGEPGKDPLPPKRGVPGQKK